MLGRGKRNAPDKNDKNDKSDKAAKAEEAAEAARLAEEAAAKAREAARLAQLAADEAEEAEADEEDDDENATKSLQKPGKRRDDPEVTSDGDNASEADSDATEADSAESEADEDDDEGEDGEPEKPRKPSVKLKKTAAAPRRSRAGGLSAVIAVLTVLTVALGAGTTALVLKVREQSATETAGKEASFAASRAAQKLSSYDYQTLDADLKEASATTTGKLHTQYDKLAAELRTVAIQQQAVSTTTVLKVGVTSATPDKVVALVYANRSSATKADKQQRLPEPLRIRLTMVKKDGKWLASELTVIS